MCLLSFYPSSGWRTRLGILDWSFFVQDDEPSSVFRLDLLQKLFFVFGMLFSSCLISSSLSLFLRLLFWLCLSLFFWLLFLASVVFIVLTFSFSLAEVFLGGFFWLVSSFRVGFFALCVIRVVLCCLVLVTLVSSTLAWELVLITVYDALLHLYLFFQPLFVIWRCWLLLMMLDSMSSSNWPFSAADFHCVLLLIDLLVFYLSPVRSQLSFRGTFFNGTS